MNSPTAPRPFAGRAATRIFVGLCAIALVLAVAVGAVRAADAIDARLAGTWKLQWQGSPIYWAVREDGVYRIHGPGAATRQAGRMVTDGGRWSVKAPNWADQGSYRVSGDTWVVTGQFGTGAWKRIWRPAAGGGGGGGAAGAGTCALLAVDDVAKALRAPVTGGPDPRRATDCLYRSQLDTADEVRVIGFPARRQKWLLDRQHPNAARIPLPGIAEDAYATTQAGGQLVANILHGGAQYRITLQLMPQAHPPTEDLAALTALARAAGRRIGSLAALPALTPEPSVPAATSRSDGTMQKGGWIPGGNRPPQKGPKPFEGWER